MSNYSDVIKALANAASAARGESSSGLNTRGAVNAYNYYTDQTHDKAKDSGAYQAIDTRTEEQKIAEGQAKHDARMEEAQQLRSGYDNALLHWIDLNSQWADKQNASAEEKAAYDAEVSQAKIALKEARSGKKEAKALETYTANWEGRDEKIAEYNRLQNAVYANNADIAAGGLGDPALANAEQRLVALREETQLKDQMAGNGVRDLNGSDRMASVIAGGMGSVSSGLTDLAGHIGEAVDRGVRRGLSFDTAEIVGYDETGAPIYNYAEEQRKANAEKAASDMSRIYAAADNLSEQAAADLTRAKEGQNALVRAGVDIGTNVVQMAFDAGVALATGGGSLAAMFARVAGESMGEARREGATLEQRFAYGFTKATIEVATEKMFDGLAGLYGKGMVSEDVIETLVRRLSNSPLGQSTLRLIASGTGEGIEELVSGVLDPIAKGILTGKVDYSELDLSELMYDAFIGFAIGFFGGGTQIANGQSRAANAQNAALTATYEQMGENPTFRQELRDRGILSNLRENSDYYSTQSVEDNTNDAMQALSGKKADATRATELREAGKAALDAAVAEEDARLGITRDKSGKFVMRNGNKITLPKTAKQQTVFGILTSDITDADIQYIASNEAYCKAFTELTGIELDGDFIDKFTTIKQSFQKAAEAQNAAEGTDVPTDAGTSSTDETGELNNGSESEGTQQNENEPVTTPEPSKKPRIGPKRGSDIAWQDYGQEAQGQAERREEENRRADVEGDIWEDDYILQQRAAQTGQQIEQQLQREQEEREREKPIGEKRGRDIADAARVEAEQEFEEREAAYGEQADIDASDFDDDAILAEQAERERRATYEERRKNGQLTDEEKSRAKERAQAVRTEDTNKRLPKLVEKLRGWAEKWSAITAEEGKANYHNDFAEAVEGFANGLVTAQELYEAYELLNAEDASTASKLFYEPDVAANLKKLAEYAEDLRTGKESDISNYQHRAENTVKNIERKTERLTNMAESRPQLLMEILSEKKAGWEGRRRALQKAIEAYLRTQSRIDSMFRFFGGFNEQASKEWYKLAERAVDSERRFVTTGYNARAYFYLLQSQSPEMAKLWREFESGKMKGNVEIPGIGKMSMNYELSILKTLSTEGGIEHFIGHGAEMAIEDDFYRGINNNGFGDNQADHHVITREDIGKLAEPYLKAEDPKHPTAEEWQAAKLEFVNKLKADLEADVFSTGFGKAVWETSIEVAKYLAREINKTSVSMFGYEKATQGEAQFGDNYYPLQEASSGYNRKANHDHKNDMDQPDFLIPRKGGDTSIKITPFTDTMLSYIQEASNWAAFAELWSDLKMLDKKMQNSPNNQTIAGMISNTYGNGALKYLERWEDLIAGNRKDTNAFNRILGKIRKNIAQASLTLNPGVALKQTPSYYAAAGIIDLDILVKNRILTGGPFRTAKSYESNPLIWEVDSRTGIISNRKATYNMIALGEALEESKSLGSKIVNRLPNWITERDVSTVSNLALACAEQVKRSYPELEVGSDEYYDAVAALLEEVVVKTQPIYDPQFRAEMLRSDNELMRSAAMFKTQPSQDFNNLYTALGEYFSAKQMLNNGGTQEAYDAAKKKLTQTIGGQFIAKMAFSVLSIVADLLAHRTKKYKDDKGNWSAINFLKRFAFGTVSSAASLLWFGDTVASIITDIATGVNPFTDNSSNFYSISESTTDLISKVVTSAITMFQTLGNTDRNGWQKAKTVKEFAVKLSSAYGIPLQNAYNIINTVVMYNLDSMPTQNFDNNDDFMRMMSNYSQMSDVSIANKTTERAVQAYKAGKLSEAETLLATLNFDSKDIVSNVQSTAKEAFINGDLSESQFKTIMRDYCKKSADDITSTIDDAKRKIEYNEAKAKNEKAFEAVEALIKAATDKRRDDDRPKDYYVMDEIVDALLSDKERDALVGVEATKGYRENYNVLRQAGMTTRKASELLEAIDNNKSGNVDATELYTWYLGHKSDEKYIAALYNSKGYKEHPTWKDFISSKKNMAYDEVRLQHENDAAFQKLDEYAKQLASDSGFYLRNAGKDQAILEQIQKMNLTASDFDAAVAQYLSPDGKKYYNAARSYGYSPDKSATLIRDIDTNENGSLKQDELIAYYKAHPELEELIKALYYAGDSKKSWEETKKAKKVA